MIRLPGLRPRFCVAALLAACAPLVFSGCAGYSVGSMLPENIRTVFVPNVINQTSEPDIENTATGAIIEEFQKNGTLDIAGREDADAILDVTLVAMELKPLQYSRSRSTEVREYRLVLYAGIKLKERGTGKTLVEYPRVGGKTSFELLGDFATVKQEAIPAAARDLAVQIVSRVVEAW